MRKLKLEELGRDSIDAFRAKEKIPVHVVLDNVRSGQNVGSILRSADAFNIRKVWLTGITPAPPHREILKTAIGASQSVAWEYHQDVESVLRGLKQEGATILGVEQTDQSIRLEDLSVEHDREYVLVFGNEVEGVSPQILPALDQAIEIRQYGTKHSLNVSVCAGIVLFWLTQQLPTQRI